MGAPEWNDKLMPQSRAFKLAGGFPLRVVHKDVLAEYDPHTKQPIAKPCVFLECPECDISIGVVSGIVTLDMLVGRVLSHMVVKHDQALSAVGGGFSESV